VVYALIFSPPIYSAGFISPKFIGGRFVVIGTILKIRRRSAGCNLQRGNLQNNQLPFTNYQKKGAYTDSV